MPASSGLALLFVASVTELSDILLSRKIPQNQNSQQARAPSLSKSTSSRKQRRAQAKKLQSVSDKMSSRHSTHATEQQEQLPRYTTLFLS